MSMERYSAKNLSATLMVSRVHPVITHCDTGVGYQIDLDHHQYREFKSPKYLSQQEFEKQVQDAKKEAQKRSKSNIVDTGETRDFYGYTARHLKATITTKMEILQTQETVDGWYVDLPEPGCAPEYIRRGHGRQITGAHAKLIPQGSVDPGSPTHPPMVDNAPRDIFIYTGFMPEGWAIEQTIMKQYHLVRNWDETSGEFLEEQQVVEFSESPLDPSLFEVPPDFDKVKELYKHGKH